MSSYSQLFAQHLDTLQQRTRDILQQQRLSGLAIHSGQTPVSAGMRQADSIISYVTRPSSIASARSMFAAASRCISSFGMPARWSQQPSTVMLME